MKSIKTHDLGLLILRVAVGILMLLHGVHKLTHGIEGIVKMLESNGLHGIFAYGVYVGEVLAPILLILGVRTRIGALLLAVNMLVVIFLAHPGDIFKLTDHGGWELELAGLYLFGALTLLFTGGGRYVLTKD